MATALILVIAVLWSLWLVLVSALVLVGATRLRRVASAARRRDRAADAAAELSALLELSLQGGVSLRRALIDVAPWVHPPLGPALLTALGRVESGWPLSGELEALVAGDHPELDGLHRLVRSVERDGVPAAGALSSLAAEGRLQRRHRLERSARRLPLQLMAPLVGGVLPAFVLLAVVPMVVSAFQGLRLR